VVYQLAEVTATVVVKSGLTSAGEAQQIVQGLQNSSSQMYADAVQQLLNMLDSTAGSVVHQSDILLRDQVTNQSGPDNFTVSVVAGILLSQPHHTAQAAAGYSSSSSTALCRRCHQASSDI